MSSSAAAEGTQQTTDTELERILAVQRANLRSIRKRTVDQRLGKLQQMREVLLRRAGEVADALNADMGRPYEEGTVSEVLNVISEIDGALAGLSEWVKPIHRTPEVSGPDSRVMSIFEPKGVVLLLGTWNFPFSLILSPLVAVVAANNSAIVKPNATSPATAAVTASIIREIFDEADVAVVTATEVSTPRGTVSINDALGELPVDHVFFTGSPRVGKVVMASAARHLASVTLELGGTNPAIVDNTADLAQVAQMFIPGKMYNAGQTCLSINHAWVPRDRREEFVSELQNAFAATLYVGEELQTDRTARIIDRRNFDRIRHLVDSALEAGATVAFGGGSDPQTLTMEPTILVDVAPTSDIAQEEIFGPILPVLTYDTPQEIYDQLESQGKPLGLYVYSTDDSFIDEVLASTSSGGVTVNSWAAHFAEGGLPFGGVGSSGQGAYHGVNGFRELSHERAVVIV